ncbi:MAG: acetate--CoA ligase [Proteobacteria bacterium]|nr:acetate--CoA ligase [Pseudomonadota bacterium]
MSQITSHSPSEHVKKGSISQIQSMEDYRSVWAKAADNPNAFWLEQTKKLIQWETEPTIGLEGDFHSVTNKPFQWFSDGRLNITESCLDRHLETRGDKVAIIWEGDEPTEQKTLTYKELHAEVCKLANALKSSGVKKGDRVIIYMGMIPEAGIAMLACARIGAIHSVVFGGFSAEALRDRIIDCGAHVILTQDSVYRGKKRVGLKDTVDEACSQLENNSVSHVFVFKHTQEKTHWEDGRDVSWNEAVEQASTDCPATICDAEDPLFILYTSGSTGKPKGVVHVCGGYITTATYTHKTVFDLRENDVYACVADVGWITGHTYIIFGPLSNGSTTLMFGSTPLYPDAGRYWDMVERHKISIFYTAPTAVRAIAAHGAEYPNRHDRSSLRVLGSVGEPIDPAAWQWYFDVVGSEHCTIVDTWWQTETGGICISPIAPATPVKPGSATLPLPGVQPILMNEQQQIQYGPSEGRLCMAHSWPGQARTIWGDHKRFVETYYSAFPGYYFTGDGCRRDGDGYYWITGRVDDVLNVSGHRFGTAEFESILTEAPEVSEAAVVGYPHPIKGQGVYAYVILNEGEDYSTELEQNLQNRVRKAIGVVAKIDQFQFSRGLPKTRSGKVMRRILRKIAELEFEQLGDVSTLADPSIVDHLINGRNNS